MKNRPRFFRKDIASFCGSSVKRLGVDDLEKQFNRWSFYLFLACLILSIHSFYSSMNQTWSVAPRAYILFFLSVFSLILGIKGFRDKSSLLAKIRGWSTILAAAVLTSLLFIGAIRPLIISEELIKTTHSPEGNYTIYFYLTNGGATTSFGVAGYLDGPLWFKKYIYRDYDIDHADIHWENNHTVSINGHSLNLRNGETYKYSEDPNWKKEHG